MRSGKLTGVDIPSGARLAILSSQGKSIAVHNLPYGGATTMGNAGQHEPELQAEVPT